MGNTTQPAKLADMVAYQKGAVVSKMLMKKSTGTVTLFSFDKGQALSEHTAPFNEKIQVLDGEGEIIVSGKPYLLTQGDMIIMPANDQHALTAVQPFKMTPTMIRS